MPNKVPRSFGSVELGSGCARAVSLWLLLAGCAMSGSIGPTSCLAQSTPESPVETLQIAPDFYVLSAGTENLVVRLMSNGWFVAGQQSPSLTRAARLLIDARPSGAHRFALAMDGPRAVSYGDGGWAKYGAQTVSHELLFAVMRNRVRTSEPGHSGVSNELPMIGFSDVFQVFLDEEEIHVMRSRPAYSNADNTVHFHTSGVLYLGPKFIMGGYPPMDLDRGGSIDGIIESLEYFPKEFNDAPDRVEPIVPGSGPLATLADLSEYVDMLRSVRGRVFNQIASGRSLPEILSMRVTAEFDAKWGRGDVSPDRFVESVYRSLLPRTPSTSPSTGPGH